MAFHGSSEADIFHIIGEASSFDRLENLFEKPGGPHAWTARLSCGRYW